MRQPNAWHTHTSEWSQEHSFTSQTVRLFLVHITSLLVLCHTHHQSSSLQSTSRLLCLSDSLSPVTQPSLQTWGLLLEVFLLSPEGKKAEKGTFSDLGTEGDVASRAVPEDVGRCHQQPPHSALTRSSRGPVPAPPSPGTAGHSGPTAAPRSLHSNGAFTWFDSQPSKATLETE